MRFFGTIDSVGRTEGGLVVKKGLAQRVHGKNFTSAHGLVKQQSATRRIWMQLERGLLKSNRSADSHVRALRTPLQFL
jgi:hypothetical protein